MKFIIYLHVAIFMCSCEWKQPYQPSEKQKITNEIRKKAAIRIKNKTGLIPCGTGGQMMDQIKMLYLGFDYREPIDINSARELLIAAVEMFAEEINGDERIRPYLDKFPFEPKNIMIDIFAQDRNGKDFWEGALCLATANNGILNFEIHDENKLLKTIHQETYEEALQKAHKALAIAQAM